ncbi:MAG: type II/IV secretion system ATPase subunit [Halolamina sp.]
MTTPTLSVAGAADPPGGVVPAPVPPDHGAAWYAPAVRAQYEVHPGVVVTVADAVGDDTHETVADDRSMPGDGFVYRAREPALSEADVAALATVREYFAEATHRRPLTREGAVERAGRGFEPKYERVLDRLLNATPAARRRLNYYALRDLRLFGPVTPAALDGEVDVVDTAIDDGHSVGDDGDSIDDDGDDGRKGAAPTADDADRGSLVVHTDRFAPARTDFDADGEYVDRVAGERLRRYEVGFAGFDVPVVVYRDHHLGGDRFATRYAALEPDLLPGDEELVAECKERIWETNVSEVVGDREAFVAGRARGFLTRRLTARNTRAWLDATRYRVRRALAAHDLAVPPVDDRYSRDRLDDLLYHVLRDFVGEGPLTVPVRDPRLEDVEANRVGERIKVVPRADVAGGDRVPTNLGFDDQTAFVNVVTQLAARDGEELNSANPSAKVNLDLDTDETVRCAVALPVVSEDGPHVSVRKQASDAMTPVDLLDRGALSTDLVALLWLAYEHRQVVLFCGPTGVGKTTLMNAHMPFVPFDDRPISIDEGSREVRLPHETGVSLTTRDHENEYKRISMADLMTETNYLNPDVAVIAEINTPESFETFAEVLNTGHGVVGTTHAEDVDTLVNRTVEQGLPTYLLSEIDLAVFPHRVDGERYVAEAVELLPADRVDGDEGRPDSEDDSRRTAGDVGVVEKGEAGVGYHVAYRRRTDGSYAFAGDDDVRSALDGPAVALFERVADATDRDVDAVEREFRRKHQYVRYLRDEGVDDFDAVFGFLADLRTDEAATVERVRAGRREAHDRGQTVGPTDLDGGRT